MKGQVCWNYDDPGNKLILLFVCSFEISCSDKLEEAFWQLGEFQCTTLRSMMVVWTISCLGRTPCSSRDLWTSIVARIVSEVPETVLIDLYSWNFFRKLLQLLWVYFFDCIMFWNKNTSLTDTLRVSIIWNHFLKFKTA